MKTSVPEPRYWHRSFSCYWKYGYIDGWLNKEVISNIFSIPFLKNMGFCIAYDSNDDQWFVSKENITMKFKED